MRLREAQLEKYVTDADTSSFKQQENVFTNEKTSNSDSDDSQEEISLHDCNLNDRENFDDLIEPEETQNSQTSMTCKQKSLPVRMWNETCQLFKKRHHSVFVFMFFIFLFWVIITINYVSFHWSKDQLSNYTKSDPKGFLIFHLCEEYVRYGYSMFGQGVLFVVACAETSMTEAGAFFYTSEASDILTSVGYVGRVFQLGLYSCILYCIILTTLNCSTIGSLFGFGWSETASSANQARATYYMLARSPPLFLHLMWSNFQGILFGTFYLWEWWWISVFMSLFYFALITMFQYIVPDKLLSMAAVYDLVIIVAMIGCIIIFVKKKFRLKYELSDWSLDRHILSRYVIRSLLMIVSNLIPSLVQVVTLALVYRRDISESLAYLAVTQPLYFFMCFGQLQNGFVLSAGPRAVHRLQYKPFLYMIAKSIIATLLFSVIIICLYLFSSLQSMCIRQISHPSLISLTKHKSASDLIAAVEMAAEPLWKIAYFGFPLALLNNLYQHFLLCFDCYGFVTIVSVCVNLFVVLVGVLISLLSLESIRSVFICYVASNIISIVVMLIYLHVWEVSKLKTKFYEMTAKKNVLQEEEKNNNDATENDAMNESEGDDSDPLLSQKNIRSIRSL
ncbi:11 TM domain-containing transmembrane protein [Acrasis kona]|uniref:11 TM domain-containing transmembrane protein n=1 Tax=Acrasis kona TaxID=1008807 RepID=A0AAW2Z4N1_9EUKA